jgi:hypothetical protein
VEKRLITSKNKPKTGVFFARQHGVSNNLPLTSVNLAFPFSVPLLFNGYFYE